MLIAERDENVCRLDFAPSEAVALAEKLKPIEKKASQEAQKEAAVKGGKTAGKGRPKNSGRKNVPKAKQDETKRTDAKVAAAVGLSRPTLARATGDIARI